MHPTVSFIVPCYKLAHLLSECLGSILAQTYTDLEVLIMDDCSPDNTLEVASSFCDPRVKHIRNASNIGHLQNYNKGITLARGRYIWLISADDVLRRSYVLERYVQLLEGHPQVGYVFCPAVTLQQGRELGTVNYSEHGNNDAIFDGRRWLARLIHENTIVAASAMARKECYEKAGNFPLNMPWNGDWYLWCAFALHFDVGYFAEPMVCYRHHDLNITHTLLAHRLDQCAAADIAMPWIIKSMAEKAGYSWLADECLRAAALEYLRRFTSRRYRTSGSTMTLEEFEASLAHNSTNSLDKARVRAFIDARLAQLPALQAQPASNQHPYRPSL